MKYAILILLFAGVCFANPFLFGSNKHVKENNICKGINVEEILQKIDTLSSKSTHIRSEFLHFI